MKPESGQNANGAADADKTGVEPEVKKIKIDDGGEKEKQEVDTRTRHDNRHQRKRG